MMVNKMKKASVLLLSATALLALGGCDVDADLTAAQKSQALISIYDESGNTTEETIYNNNLEAIYDLVVTSGNTNSEQVLNNLLYLLAKSYFGVFYDTDETTGIKTLVEDGDDAALLSFTKEHEIYLSYDDDGNIDEDASIANVVDFYDSLVDSFKQSFWDTVNNTAYQERYRFEEWKFYDAMEEALFDLVEVDYDDLVIKELDGAYTYEDVELYFTDFLNTYEGYIEISLMPDAYRHQLVEQYLFDHNYGVIGRSYARKIQYIALDNVDNQNLATQKLIKAYASIVLADETVGDGKFSYNGTDVTVVDETVYTDFTFLDKVYKGSLEYDTTNEEYSQEVIDVANLVYDAAGWTLYTEDDDATYSDDYKSYTKDGVTYANYRLETEFGQTMDDYLKLSDNRFTTGSSTDYTNNGAYTKATGLEIKTREIKADSNVDEGWYTPSTMSGLSDFSTRLFKISVANEVDGLNIDDDGNLITSGRVEGDYGWYVNGNYYMVPETYQNSDEVPYCLYSDDTWYLIRVDEAVKTAKMVIGGDRSYSAIARKEGALTQHQIGVKIADILADSDSYVQASNQYYVEQAAIAYHDDTIYYYFKDLFPDLFD